MTTPRVIGPEVEGLLDWLALADALEAGHRLPRAEMADSILHQGDDAVLTRSAWIRGLGIAVKPASVFPGNTAHRDRQSTVHSSC